ncbi:hypothetical protein E3T37_12620 [Cryobacterium sp. TMT2-10]|uniref:restriction endonuclease n=1 Tax=Cryobacterium sp. TMT2-10 TaxID=1259244 RepID=UPI001069AB70|nr:restriction endonuclease [Cryobacterium sp. TMT2-10]TFD37035.1 hypothetical protein E3T37_12620 [Cryobacterium sp. TMT2-10]
MTTQMRTMDETSCLLPFIDPIGDYDEIQFSPEGRVSYLRSGKRHRLDGPARSGGGMEWWYWDGMPHRDDGPARITKHYRGTADTYRHIPPRRAGAESPLGKWQLAEFWYTHGLLNRFDGPAIRWEDGTEEWFSQNRRHRVGGPAVIGSDGLREWHQVVPGRGTESCYTPSFYVIQNNNEFFREYGPSVVLGNGTRYWGSGSVGGYDGRMPSSGPWIEYRDGSVDFIQNGSVRNRDADHPFTVTLRRDGRHYVASEFSNSSGPWFDGASFLPFMDGTEFFEDTWRRANLEDRRLHSAWAVDQWERVQGNVSHDDEDQIARWLERFKQTVDEEREEARILRDDMHGYLRVALRRLDGVTEPSLDDLQDLMTMAGLPLTGVVAQLTPESRLLRAVVTAPSLDEAISRVMMPTHFSGPLPKPKQRAPKIVNELYVNGIAELALAALAAIVVCDGVELADTVLLNVMVDEVDRATGHEKRFCVLSIQVEREVFEGLNLDRVDPLECVKALGAVVPRGTNDLVPVRPIIAFDKEDARIVAAVDIASRLDSRPNLMDLTPNEFESLIQNLFTKIGLDTHQTQASRDGGVDAIAYDSRPIFGGKIIIQAKRYKNTVGVSAVRDLYGTVMNEGASKGLLITTSGYGKSSFEFAKNKPLELLEGGHLLHLLKEHMDMDAVIVPPITWVDPVVDIEAPHLEWK